MESLWHRTLYGTIAVGNRIENAETNRLAIYIKEVAIKIPESQRFSALHSVRICAGREDFQQRAEPQNTRKGSVGLFFVPRIPRILRLEHFQKMCSRRRQSAPIESLRVYMARTDVRGYEIYGTALPKEIIAVQLESAFSGEAFPIRVYPCASVAKLFWLRRQPRQAISAL